MPVCMAPGCKNSRGLARLSFFQVPDASRCQRKRPLAAKWLEQLGCRVPVDEFPYGHHKVVCELHFDPACLAAKESKDGRASRKRSLLPDAYPTRYLSIVDPAPVVSTVMAARIKKELAAGELGTDGQRRRVSASSSMSMTVDPSRLFSPSMSWPPQYMGHQNDETVSSVGQAYSADSALRYRKVSPDEIDKIIDVRQKDGGMEYLVKWKSQYNSPDSWVGMDSFEKHMPLKLEHDLQPDSASSLILSVTQQHLQQQQQQLQRRLQQQSELNQGTELPPNSNWLLPSFVLDLSSADPQQNQPQQQPQPRPAKRSAEEPSDLSSTPSSGGSLVVDQLLYKKERKKRKPSNPAWAGPPAADDGVRHVADGIELQENKYPDTSMVSKANSTDSSKRPLDMTVNKPSHSSSSTSDAIVDHSPTSQGDTQVTGQGHSPEIQGHQAMVDGQTLKANIVSQHSVFSQDTVADIAGVGDNDPGDVTVDVTDDRSIEIIVNDDLDSYSLMEADQPNDVRANLSPSLSSVPNDRPRLHTGGTGMNRRGRRRIRDLNSGTTTQIGNLQRFIRDTMNLFVNHLETQNRSFLAFEEARRESDLRFQREMFKSQREHERRITEILSSHLSSASPDVRHSLCQAPSCFRSSSLNAAADANYNVANSNNIVNDNNNSVDSGDMAGADDNGARTAAQSLNRVLILNGKK